MKKLCLVMLIVVLFAGCSSNTFVPKNTTVDGNIDSLCYYIERKDLTGLEPLFTDEVYYHDWEQGQLVPRDELMGYMAINLSVMKEFHYYQIYNREVTTSTDSIIVEAQVKMKGTSILGVTGGAEYIIIIKLSNFGGSWLITGITDPFYY